MDGLDPEKLPGLVVDDQQAKRTGNWTKGTGLKGYVGYGDRYASAGSGATAKFELKAADTGEYDIRIASQPHENRARHANIRVVANGKTKAATVNMTKAPEMPNGFIQLTRWKLTKGEPVEVTFTTQDSGGIVHIDAVQLIPAK